ncbi:hypothetical protein Q7P35_001299 [Cladosporium inversicolor]
MDEHSERLIQSAFGHNHDLERRTLDASRKFQNGIPELLRDISTFILSLKKSGEVQDFPIRGDNQVPTEPTAKKRKLEQSNEATARSMESTNGSYDISNTPKICFEIKDVSFTSPIRKKMKLQFITDDLNISKRQIRLLNQATNAVEYTLRGEDIEALFCLPVPEKTQRQQCFLVFPLPGSQSYEGTPAEPLVWTMNEIKGSAEVASVSTSLHGSEDETFVDIMRRELDHHVACLGQKLILPNEREFASEIPQTHRKGEKAFHTKAFRGSKEGYLYLLSTGIVFGFKKPVAFFPFASIESISFTSVLQRTFNIVITTTDPSDATKQTEHELSMVDQADFQPIDAYIRAHGLNDASMAAERRAKIHNVNKPAAGEEVGDGEGDVDGRGEIEKAEAMLQDQEDEEEEDYDPSGGESEGSGEDSDEEDGEGEGYEEGEEGEEEEWDEEEEVGAEEEAA